MKKLLLVCLSILLSLAVFAPALAAEGRVIRAVGNAHVSLAADTVSLQIGVNTRKETVREAQTENAGLMAAVMDAIHALGVEDKDIVTSQFNIYSDFEYTMDSLGREQRIAFYQVQNNVTVTLHDISMVGPVLDAAMEAGANTSYGITFTSSQANEAYLLALSRAVEDAARKAQVMAEAAGVKLGRLLSINAGQTYSDWETPAVSNTYRYEAKGADVGTSISSGDVSVSAEVTLEYEME